MCVPPIAAVMAIAHLWCSMAFLRTAASGLTGLLSAPQQVTVVEARPSFFSSWPIFLKWASSPWKSGISTPS